MPGLIAKLVGSRAVFVEQVRGPSDAAGRAFPAHATALGKALLAEAPTSVLDEVVLDAWTTRTITDRHELEADLALTRERGWALEDGELDLTRRSIGAVGATTPEWRWRPSGSAISARTCPRAAARAGAGRHRAGQGDQRRPRRGVGASAAAPRGSGDRGDRAPGSTGAPEGHAGGEVWGAGGDGTPTCSSRAHDSGRPADRAGGCRTACGVAAHGPARMREGRLAFVQERRAPRCASLSVPSWSTSRALPNPRPTFPRRLRRTSNASSGLWRRAAHGALPRPARGSPASRIRSARARSRSRNASMAAGASARPLRSACTYVRAVNPASRCPRRAAIS